MEAAQAEAQSRKAMSGRCSEFPEEPHAALHPLLSFQTDRVSLSLRCPCVLSPRAAQVASGSAAASVMGCACCLRSVLFSRASSGLLPEASRRSTAHSQGD